VLASSLYICVSFHLHHSVFPHSHHCIEKEKHQQQQQASRRPTRQRSQPRRSSNGTSSSSGGEDELKAAFRRRSSASQGRAHSSGGNDNHSPETRRRLTLEALKEEEASSGASHLTGVLQNLRKAPRPTPAKGEKLLERSAYSLDDTSGGGGDHDGSGGQSTGLYARSSLRRSSMDNLLEEAAAEGQATSATDLWKEALLKKERKKREKLEREAAEAAAAEAAAAAAAEASALMSPGGGGHEMEPPATARKEITKGAVSVDANILAHIHAPVAVITIPTSNPLNSNEYIVHTRFFFLSVFLISLLLS